MGSNRAIIFDSHKLYKNLVKHGFTEEQAEVLVTEMANLLNNHLSTEDDIDVKSLNRETD